MRRAPGWQRVRTAAAGVLALLMVCAAGANPSRLPAATAAPAEAAVAASNEALARGDSSSRQNAATRRDTLVQLGQDQPQRALAALASLAAQDGDTRAWALARGLVAASSGLPDDLQAALLALAALAPDPLAAADAALVRATAADARGNSSAAFGAATAALDGYKAGCARQAACDHRPHWQALQLLTRQDRRRGLNSAALAHALAASELARAAGDAPRQALALADAADLAAEQGNTEAEQRHFAEAQQLARADGGRLLRSRLQLYETRMQRRNGDLNAARRAALAGLAQARQADSPRLAAMHLANLGDVLVALGQPGQALQAIEEALPAVRRHADRSTERALLHNAALARIGLRQWADARRDVASVLAAYREDGASADHAVALREFGDAYAAAGDMRAALALFHQERKLAAEIMAANRDAALTELRQRFDQEAQQRRLEQLGRERTLVTTQLDNRAAMQKVWAAGAAVLLLAAVLVALMYRRVRRLKRRLEDNHAQLREQSHRDPLTGLHNRRGLHETMAARGRLHSFEGALLLLDIDHFKRINDGHGHAAGDAVLVEVSRRLSQAVRGDDLVVRWGGEEFIVCMTSACSHGEAQTLVRRVLDAIGSAPVALPGGDMLRVTVSGGFAAFPLPPAQLPLALERAINLVDMALYTAKNQGRNNAMGIALAAAGNNAALQALETDFNLARSEGRVTLERLNGPAAAGLPEAHAAGPAAAPEAAATAARKALQPR